jgi:hypothetical protein
MKQPPKVATHLLMCLGPEDESLTGDLFEEYGAGRSRLWYWRQVLSAILVGAAGDFRHHPRPAVRAVLIGWVVLIPWFYFTIAVYRRVLSWAGGNAWVPGVWFDADSVLLRMAWWAWWIYEVPLVIAWCGGSLIIGRMIVRLHREHRAAALFACVASQLPWTVLWAWPVWQNAHVALVHTAYAFPNQLLAALILAGMPMCTLLGGVWGRDGRQLND